MDVSRRAVVEVTRQTAPLSREERADRAERGREGPRLAGSQQSPNHQAQVMAGRGDQPGLADFSSPRTHNRRPPPVSRS